MRLFADNTVILWLIVILIGGSGCLTGWPRLLSQDLQADTAVLKAPLERQQEAKPAEPGPDWRKLLEPVRPPLDPDVLALSDRDRDELVGPVKIVRQGIEFTSAANPEWSPEWANRPESDDYRTITYDVNGMKVSDVVRPGCGNHPPEKMIYDTKGRLLEQITYTDDAVVYRRELFCYNARGWLVETNDFSADEGTYSQWIYEYVVDSHGNWISQIPRCVSGCPPPVENGLQGVLCRSLTYYE